MHAYLITAKRSRWQRAGRRARVCTVRFAGALLMLVLAPLVLACRLARPIVNWIATGAAHLELWLSIRLNLPALGSLSGVALMREFVREFNNAFNPTTTNGRKSER